MDLRSHYVCETHKLQSYLGHVQDHSKIAHPVHHMVATASIPINRYFIVQTVFRLLNG
jgi:hypothetical protein